jgi:hypothetical protein
MSESNINTIALVIIAILNSGFIISLIDTRSRNKRLETENKKIDAEKNKLISEAKEIDTNSDLNVMKAITESSRVTAESSGQTLKGAIERIEVLENKLREKDDVITYLRQELINNDKKWQGKISRMMVSIRSSIEKRNKLSIENRCAHDCVAVDIELETQLGLILQNGN